MTRKEFIISALKVFKIVVLLALFLYLINFIENAVFNEDSIEKNILIVVCISIGLLVVLGFTGLILEKIRTTFSEKTKSFLNTFSTIMEYASLLFLGYLAYIHWNENKVTIIFSTVIILFIFLNKFFQQTKKTE